MVHGTLDEFVKFVQENGSHIYEATLTNDSEEVTTTIAGYVGKKLSERSKCNRCEYSLISTTDKFDNKCFNMLSRENLSIPSHSLAKFWILLMTKLPLFDLFVL